MKWKNKEEVEKLAEQKYPISDWMSNSNDEWDIRNVNDILSTRKDFIEIYEMGRNDAMEYFEKYEY